MVQDHYNNMKEEPSDTVSAEPGGNIQRGADAGAATDDHAYGDRRNAVERGERPDIAGASMHKLSDHEDDATAGIAEELVEAGQEADEESAGTSNLASQRSKRTPKPSAKAQQATPMSRKAGAVPGNTPRSGKSGRAPDALDASTARKKRGRKLFADDGEDQNAQGQEPSYLDRWREQHQNDDVGEGVDALLSLASIAHASSSMNEDTKPDEPGPGEIAPPEDEATGEEGMGRRRPARASAVGAGQLLQGILSSPSKSRGRSSQVSRSTPQRGSPPGRGRGARTSRLVQQEPPRATPGSTGQRSRRTARRNSSLPTHQSANSSEGDAQTDSLMDGVPMMVPPVKTSSAVEAPRSNSLLGKRSVDLGPGALARRGSAQPGLETQPLLMMPEAADMPFGYDPALLAAMAAMPPYGFLPQPLDPYARPLNTGPLPPVSARLSQYSRQTPGTLPVRMRRRKPMPERLAPLSPVIKALLPSTARAGATGGGLTTPTAAAAAAAAGGPLSPSMLASPGFLAAMGGPPSSALRLGGDLLLSSDLLSAGPTEASLRRCLLSARARRWCMFEFHCSALDRPWFMRSEMTEVLQHICGGPGAPIPQRLTSGEWAILRGAFGKPRRLSLQFLKEERIKLEAYREHVRQKYEEVGVGHEVPSELPRPLRVGQLVVARHPISRQLHDGVILTVQGSKYRVQFNRSELLTEVVRDVDVMPADPFENLPLSVTNLPLVLNGRPGIVAGGAKRKNSAVPRPITSRLGPSDLRMAGLAGIGLEPDTLIKEADGALLAEVTAKLEAKEALVNRLKEMNTEAETGVHLDENGRNSEQFQKQYSQVVQQLKDVNTQLEAMLQRLAGRTQQVAVAASVLGTSPAGSTSPIAAVPPGSATAMTARALGGEMGSLVTMASLGPSTGSGLPGGGAPGSSSQDGALAADQLSLQQRQPSLQQGLGMALPDVLLGGLVTGDHVEDASALVSAALEDARAVVEVCARQRQGAMNSEAAAAVAGEDGPAPQLDQLRGGPAGSGRAGGQDRRDAWLDRVITGCVGVLFSVQRCIEGVPSGPTVEQALDIAVRSIQPRARANQAIYADIAENVRMLKGHLSSKAC